MVYEYACPACHRHWDVIKRVSEMDAEETCVCKAIGVRQFIPQKIHLSGTKVEEAEFNPGLGCIVKNKNHRKELAKQKGLEEIGNEKPETIHKHFDQRRSEKWERVWAEADKGWVGEG